MSYRLVASLTKQEGVVFEHCIFESREAAFGTDPNATTTPSADFYSFKCTNESIDFIHVSPVSNKNSILAGGLRKGIGHLGEGVYAIQVQDEVGFRNLKSFVHNAALNSPQTELVQSNKVLVVGGIYFGEILYCFEGAYGHTGYNLLESVNAASIMYVEEMELDLFYALSQSELRDRFDKAIYQHYLLENAQ